MTNPLVGLKPALEVLTPVSITPAMWLKKEGD